MTLGVEEGKKIRVFGLGIYFSSPAKFIIIISDLLIHTLDLWINTVSPSKNELTRTFLEHRRGGL